MKLRGHIGCAIGLLGVLAIALKWLPEPFLWAGVGTVLLGGVAAVRSGRSKARMIWYNLAMCGLIFGAVECWLTVGARRAAAKPKTHHEGSYTYGYMDVHEVVGYGPKTRGRVESRKMFKDEVVYDVEYTILDSGLRNACSADDAKRSMVFFGGSYMFGEGVNDAETLPCALQSRLETPWAMYNFGFHGYGPHQMVAALQSDMVRDLAEVPPAHVFFMTAGFHVGRANGVKQLRGPQYHLEADGQLSRDGFFEGQPAAPQTAWKRKLLLQAKKSRLFRKVTKRRYLQGEPEIALYLALVREARDQVAGQFPDAKFSLIFWKLDNALGERLLKRLAEEAFTVYEVDDALDPTRDPMDYKLGIHDGHPNPTAFAALADYLAIEVIEPGP